MNVKKKIAGVAGLAAVLSTVFAAVASPPPRPSSFYGTIGTDGFEIPADTLVSAWIGGTKLAEAPVFTADGAPSFSIDIPGDIVETTAVEGGREGQAVSFKVGGAPAPQTAAWQSGTYRRLDLTAPAGPDLSVTLDDGVASVFPGGTLTYTVTIRNNGQQTASGVVLRDTLPVAVTVESASGGTVDMASSPASVTWPAFDLAAGASTVRTVVLKVATTGIPVGTEAIVNQVSIKNDGSQGLDPKLSNNAAADSDALRVPPDFAIGDADVGVTPPQPQAGQPVTVSLTVRNAGEQSGTAQVAVYNGPPLTGAVVWSEPVTLAAHATFTKTFQFLPAVRPALISAVADPANLVVEADEGNNIGRKFLAQVPDLAVGFDNVNLSPAAPRGGDAVDVSVTVRNAGQTAAANVAVAVFDGEPDRGAPQIFAGQIPAIPVGGNQTVRFTWPAVEGQRRITAVVDPANAILELSETNNQAQRVVTVPRAAGPDLTVGSVDASGLGQSPLTLVASGTVRAVIANSGDAPVGPGFAVRLFEDRDGDGTFSAGDRELARQSLPAGLAAGASVESSLAVASGLAFYHSLLWVEADADQEVEEKSEENNRGAVFGACETTDTASVTPVVEKWYLPGMEVESTPVVVQLTDDNGDGRIDSRDVPDIAFHTETSAGRAVTARSGLDGSEIWTFPSTIVDPLASRLAHLAAADLDGDGVAEILASRTDRKLMALNHSGQKLWMSDVLDMPGQDWAGGPSVGDLTGDGVPEIVVGRSALSNTGKLLATGDSNRGENYNYYGPLGVPVAPGVDAYHSIIADLDLDGRAEIVAGDAVYRLQAGAQGAWSMVKLWDATVKDNLMRDGYSAVGNLDNDPEPEIVYVSSNFVMVLQHDGQVLANYRQVVPLSPVVQPTPWAGPPTIADLDGDGRPEILIAGDTELVALRANLSYLWRKPIDELAGQTAATVFDLDGDGKPEVIYLDQSNLYILNGQTGETLHERPNISKTGTEYPVVADVDNDGQAEILVPSNAGFDGNTSTQGLHVLGNPTWRGARPIWNQYSYHGTNVLLDGTVPSPEPPVWQQTNTWRVNPGVERTPHLLPNATVSLPRVGAATSSGIPVRLRVGNGARGTLPAGTVVTLYNGTPAQNRVAAQGVTTRALPPGAWQDLDLQWQQAGPAGAAATAMVDADGKITECDETDNSVAFNITETVMPDLAIPVGGVTVQASPVAGQKIAVQVRVTNLGPAASAATAVRLVDGAPGVGTVAGTVPLAALAPGASATVTLTWDSLGAAGTRQLFAVADPDDLVPELQEGNNQGSVSVTLAAPTKPDLSLDALTLDPPATDIGTPVQLTADISNRGTALPAGWTVAFLVNNLEAGRVASPDPLAAGAHTTVSFTLQTVSYSGRVLLEAKGDPANAVSEQNEANNSQTAFLELASRGFAATIRTERVSYPSNDTVHLTVSTQNSGAPRPAALRVTINDAAGNVLATVNDQPLTLPTGTQSFDFTWPTGTTAAGAYAAVADLVLDGTVAARGSAPFFILGDRSATATLFTERDRYEPLQSVTLTGRVRNTGVNESLLGLTARLLVTGPTGTAVFTQSLPVPVLDPGVEKPVDGVWPVGTAAPGVYTARLELRESSGGLLAFASVPVTVLDSGETGSGLTGTLQVGPNPVGAGAPLLARFTTANGGNADMASLRLALRLVRVADGEAVAASEIPWPLTRNQQRSGSLVFDTAQLAEGDYRAELAGLLPSGEVSLASTPFQAGRGVSVLDASAQEGDSGTLSMTFEVRLSSPSAAVVQVGWRTSDGTAVAPGDYQAAAGTLEFQPGEVQKTVTVAVNGDTAPEASEVFLVELTAPVGALLGDSQALGTILDEEGCGGPSLPANGSAEAGTSDADLPGWSVVSGAWGRRFGDPVPLDGAAALAVSGPGDAAELRQDVDLTPYAARIDGPGGQPMLFEAFVQSLPTGSTADAARILVEYRDASKSALLGSFDSGEVTTAGSWKAVVDARAVPAGTRWARLRLIGVRRSPSGVDVAFDRVALRSLGVPVVTAGDPMVLEGNSGTTPARFTLQLSCPAPAPVNVAWATADGTAKAGSDYETATGTAAFAAGDTQRTVDVAVKGDTSDEADETFFLDLTAGSDVVILGARHTATIQNDDGAVTAAAGDVFVDEAAGTATFAVSLSDPSGKTVTVSYATVDGTAEANKDFAPAAGILTFPAGVQSLTVDVSLLDDGIDEDDETFTLRLSAPVNASLADADGLATIRDDDEARLTIGDAAVDEGNGGNGAAVTAVFPVTLTLPSSRPVQVAYTTVDATALAGTDYTAASGTLTLAAGATSGSIAVSVLGNTTPQADRLFRVRLDNSQGASLLDPEADGTIRDDDGVRITIDDAAVKEGDSGTANLTVNVRVANQTQTVTVSWATADGTAKAGTDYTAVSGTLSFPPGTSLRSITVPIVGDLAEEQLIETFQVRLSNPSTGSLQRPNATITIADNDGWVLTDQANATAIPGCIFLAQAGYGRAWYKQRIDLNQSFDQTYKVYLGDKDAGGDGLTFTLQNAGTNPSAYDDPNGMGYTGIAPSIGVEIDTAQKTDIGIGDLLADHIGVDLNGNNDHYGYRAVPAMPGGANIEDGKLHDLRVVWNAGAKQLDVHFDGAERLKLSQDLVAQIFGSNSSVYYGLTSSSPGPVPNQHYFCPTVQCFDDSQPKQVSVGDVHLLEATSGPVSAVFPVTLSCASTQRITVSYRTIDGTAVAGSDYTAATGTVTFEPGETSKSVAVTVLSDAATEPSETFRLALSNPTNAAIRYGEGVATLIGEDIVHLQPGRMAENWTGELFDVTLSEPLPFPISFDWEAVSGTAVMWSDFEGASSSVSFRPGETFQTLSVRLAVDSIVEPDETFYLQTKNASSRLVPARLPVTIADVNSCQGNNLIQNPGADLPMSGSQIPGWTQVAGTWSSAGRFPGRFEVLQGQLAELRQDIDVSSFASLIAAGQQRFLFEGFVQDWVWDVPQDTSRFILEFRDATNTQVLGTWDSQELRSVCFCWRRIADVLSVPVGTGWVRVRLIARMNLAPYNDGWFESLKLVPYGVPNLRVEDAQKEEGSLDSRTMPFQVKLECPGTQTVTVSYLTTDGTAKAGTDYTPTLGTLTFGPGESLKTVQVPILDDAEVESAETFSFTITNAVNAGISRATATGTILGDEPYLSIADKWQAEGQSGTRDMVFDVTLSAASQLPIRVDWTTADGTAAAGSDYVAASGTLDFAPGQTQATVTVKVLGDAVKEPDETFFVRLGNPSLAYIADGEAVGTVGQDDIFLSVARDVSVLERDGSGGQESTAVFEITLSEPSTQTVTVNYALRDDTAISWQDFNNYGQGQIVFQPGETLKRQPIIIIGDLVAEPAEQFYFVLNTPVNAQILTGERRGVILDDDDCPSANLIVNGGADDVLANGKAAGWTETPGSTWTRDFNFHYFLPTSGREAELQQDVDLSPWAERIDTGTQRLLFEGFVRSVNETAPDPGRIVVEYRDAANANVLTFFDSGDVVRTDGSFQELSDLRAVPAGTRWARVRLIAHSDSAADTLASTFFDTLSLRSLNVPTLSLGDTLTVERNAGSSNLATLRMTLSCAWSDPVTVTFTTADGTSVAGSDYVATTGTGTIPVGQLTGEISIPILGDVTPEPEESFLVNLSNSSRPAVRRPQGKVTIVDNDQTSFLPLFGTVRDFHYNHPDFQRFDPTNVIKGIVKPVLGADKKPVYKDGAVAATTTGKANFDQWYRDVANVNLSAPLVLILPQDPARPTWYKVEGPFFPIDNQLFGNEGSSNNFHFTYELHSRFLYSGGEVLNVAGDDDLWIFINNKLAIDIGGVHVASADSIKLDDVAATLGLVPGQIYDFDLFYAERRTNGSWLKLETNIPLGNVKAGVIQLAQPTAQISENGGAAALTVTRTQGVEGNVSVTYATADGTAKAPGDYTAATGTVTFSDGDAAPKTITIPVVDDPDYETAEAFQVVLSNPTAGAALGPVASAVVTIPENDAKPDLTATKTDALVVDADGNGAASPGDKLRYTVTVTSTGTLAASNVVLTDPVPANTQLVAGSVATTQGSVTGQSPVTVSLGALAPGASATVTFEVTIADPFPTTVSEVRNQGKVTADGLTERLTDDPDTPAAGDATVTPVVNKPDLKATKTAALAVDKDHDGKPSPGDTVRYEIKIVNSGSGRATDVVLDDPIPAHTSVVAGSLQTDRGSVAGETPVRVNVGEIPAGQTAVIRFDVTIENPLPADVDRLTNQGTVASRELPAVLTDDPVPAGANDPTVTLVAAAPDLVAEKTVTLAVDADDDNKPSPGDTLEYLVTVRNRGNRAATAVAFSDPVPAHTSLVAGSIVASQGTVQPGNPVQAALGNLAGGGATATVRFRVTIEKPIATGIREISNQGEVRAAGLGPVLTDDPTVDGAANATVTQVTATPVLAVEKSATLAVDADGDSAASPGDTLLYTLRVKSTGNTAATQVAVDDTVGEGMSYEAGSLQTSQGTIVTEQPVKVNLGELPSGTTATVTFRVTLADPFPSTLTAVSNQATVTSQGLSPVPSDDPATTAVAGDPTVTPVFVKPAITVEDATVAEGAGSAQVTVRLSKASNREAKVDYATPAGTATADDFTAAAGTLTFAPGETEKTINVPIASDLLDEPDETFTVILSAPVLAVLADAEATVTITDDDDPPTIIVGSLTVAESIGTATVAVTLSAPSGREVQVSYTTADGTAKAGSDYTAAANTLVFPAGTTSLSVPVTVLNDALDENDETFSIALTNPVNATAGGAGAVTITDDDEAPAVSISDVTMTEGDSGSVTAELTVSLAEGSGLDATVDFTTADVTAQAGSDYQTATGTVTIPAGSTTAKVSVQVLGDTLDELDESFKVVLSNPVNAIPGDSEGLVTVTDDDQAALSIGDARVTEGNSGTTDAVFTVRLSTASDREVKVDYVTKAGTATEGTDYEETHGTVAFAAGETEKTVTVQVIADTLLEAAEETYTVELSNASNAQIGDDSGQGGIVDDEQCPGPNLLVQTGWSLVGGELVEDVDLSDFTSRIASGLSFSIEGQAQAGARMVVEYRNADGTAVLAVYDTGVLPTAGHVSDVRTAPAGTGSIHVRLVSGGADAFDGLSLRPLRVPFLSVADATVQEGGEAKFTVSLSCPADREVTVAYATAGGTAQADADFTTSSGTLTFAAGETSQSVSVATAGDSLDENYETFTLALSNPAEALLADAQALGTITDDDQAPAVSFSDVTVTEGDSGAVTAELTVSLAAVSGLDATVAFATVDGTAQAGSDYQTESGTVTIPAGSLTAKVNVQVLGDTLDELDEAFKVVLSNPVNAVPGDPEGLVTILDDDEPPSITVGSLTVAESGGTATVPVTLSAPSGLEVKVDYATADGTAKAGADYTAAANTLVFPAGTTSLTVPVAVLNDALDEDDETFTVALTNPVNATVGGAGTVTITDDDEMPSLSVADVTVQEGAGAATVTVSLSAPSGRGVQVNYATADGTAQAGSDYTAAQGTLSFAAGATTATFPVQVTGDVLHENSETFLVNLSNPVHATIADGQGTVTITDDDAAPTLSVSNAMVKEGDSGTVTAELTVSLSAVSGLAASAPVSTMDVTAKAGGDYVALSSTVDIPAGSLTGKVQVQVLGDLVDESDETFKVTVGSAEAVVTITDDDEAKLVADDVRVDEGNTGTTDAVFPVRLTHPSDRKITVDYVTAAGTATEGTDYHRASGTLTFEPGEDRKTVTVQVVGDTRFEEDETFHLDLSGAVSAPIQDGRGTATIADDEACPSPNLLANPGAEISSATTGQIPGWTVAMGTQWQTRGTNPLPAEGKTYFYAGAGNRAELVQTVDVSAYAARIATGEQRFAFEGSVRTANEQPSDTARIVVEYLDPTGIVVLDAFDSGQIASPLEWRPVADTRPAPAGTARLRVRLIADQFQGTSLDGYFDGLSLRALRAPSLLIGDVTAYEGQAGTRNAVFPLSLTCPVDQSVTVVYTTADGTAVAGADYTAASGTLTFPAGSTQQSVPVGILGDRIDEGAETFQVRLSGQTPASAVALLDPVGVGTILSDDFCPRSPGYWKNHTSLWRLSSVVIGGRTYNAAQMLAFLDYGASDASMHLARQVVTTLLNLAAGSSPSVLPDLDAADVFLAGVPPGSNPTGAVSDQATQLKNRLEAYNNDVCKD